MIDGLKCIAILRQVVQVPEDRNGALDRVELQRLLQQYQDRELRIGIINICLLSIFFLRDTSRVVTVLINIILT